MGRTAAAKRRAARDELQGAAQAAAAATQAAAIRTAEIAAAATTAAAAALMAAGQAANGNTAHAADDGTSGSEGLPDMVSESSDAGGGVTRGTDTETSDESSADDDMRNNIIFNLLQAVPERHRREQLLEKLITELSRKKKKPAVVTPVAKAVPSPGKNVRFATPTEPPVVPKKNSKKEPDKKEPDNLPDAWARPESTTQESFEPYCPICERTDCGCSLCHRVSCQGGCDQRPTYAEHEWWSKQAQANSEWDDPPWDEAADDLAWDEWHGYKQEEEEDGRGDRPSDKPPDFDGTPTRHEAWLRQVELWMADTKCPKKKWGLRILRSLTGNAAVIAETLPVQQLRGTNGYQLVMDIIAERCSEQSDTTMQRKFDNVVAAKVRKSSTPMPNYINDMMTDIYKLEHAIDEKLPDRLKGYLFWKKAGLGDKEKTAVLTHTNLSWEMDMITRALKGLFANIHLRQPREHGQKVFVANELSDGNDGTLYPEEEPESGDEDAETYEAAEDDDDDDIMEEEEIQEVLASYVQARKALKHKETSRGFNKTKLVSKTKERSHTTRSATSGSSAPGGWPLGSKKYEITLSDKSKSRCGKCGRIGHWASECTHEARSKEQRIKDEGKPGSSKSYFVTGDCSDEEDN